MLSEKEKKYIERIKREQKFVIAVAIIILSSLVLWIFYANSFLDRLDFPSSIKQHQKKISEIEPKTELELKLKKMVLEGIEFERELFQLFVDGITVMVSLGCLLGAGELLFRYFDHKKFLSLLKKHGLIYEDSLS